MKTKAFIRLSIFLGAIILLYSCRSTKEFTYLHDITNDSKILSDQSIQAYKVKKFDNLYISIVTLNPEVNALFDSNASPSGYNSGTVSNYGDNTSQYINGYQIDSNGNIDLPLIGTIQVEGLSLDQIKDAIYKKSLSYLKEPNIKVKLLSFKVNVSGEVKNSGIYYSYNEKLTILEAISMAGGVTDNAKIKKALVVRQEGKISHAFEVDLTSKDFILSKAYYLQPDDFIYIKPSKNKKSELNSTNYSLFLSTITTILLIFNIIK